jgi:hypothetical protein
MISKFVTTRAITTLTIGAVLAFHSAAWSQSCSTASVQSSISCSSPGEKCSGASEAGKPALQGVCKTVAKAGGSSACSCFDAKGATILAGTHSLALRGKVGGGGWIAFFTFLGLVGLWSLVSVLKSRKTTA